MDSASASAHGISGATVSTGPSRRNAPVWQFSDTLTWTKGSHSMSFGGFFLRLIVELVSDAGSGASRLELLPSIRPI
ncbi:MAG: hypothetical protein IPJ07_25495 [Acidobacteria bacterium]|nr:hypothetical protein [Acidobacteriota bacterium]